MRRFPRFSIILLPSACLFRAGSFDVVAVVVVVDVSFPVPSMEPQILRTGLLRSTVRRRVRLFLFLCLFLSSLSRASSSFARVALCGASVVVVVVVVVVAAPA